jgi:hypothetical protein
VISGCDHACSQLCTFVDYKKAFDNVQDYEDCKAEALRQLTDPVIYKPLQGDPTRSTAEQSNKLLQLLDGELISETTFKWEKQDTENTRCHTFYHLPKVH